MTPGNKTMQWYEATMFEPPYGEHVVVAITGVGRFSGWTEAIYCKDGKYMSVGFGGTGWVVGVTHYMIPRNPLKTE